MLKPKNMYVFCLIGYIFMIVRKHWGNFIIEKFKWLSWICSLTKALIPQNTFSITTNSDEQISSNRFENHVHCYEQYFSPSLWTKNQA